MRAAASRRMGASCTYYRKALPKWPLKLICLYSAAFRFDELWEIVLGAPAHHLRTSCLAVPPALKRAGEESLRLIGHLPTFSLGTLTNPLDTCGVSAPLQKGLFGVGFAHARQGTPSPETPTLLPIIRCKIESRQSLTAIPHHSFVSAVHYHCIADAFVLQYLYIQKHFPAKEVSSCSQMSANLPPGRWSSPL